jgi:hypothetical protein
MASSTFSFLFWISFREHLVAHKPQDRDAWCKLLKFGCLHELLVQADTLIKAYSAASLTGSGQLELFCGARIHSCGGCARHVWVAAAMEMAQYRKSGERNSLTAPPFSSLYLHAPLSPAKSKPPSPLRARWRWLWRELLHNTDKEGGGGHRRQA